VSLLKEETVPPRRMRQKKKKEKLFRDGVIALSLKIIEQFEMRGGRTKRKRENYDHLEEDSKNL